MREERQYKEDGDWLPAFESFLLPVPINSVTLLHSVYEGQPPGFTRITMEPCVNQQVKPVMVS